MRKNIRNRDSGTVPLQQYFSYIVIKQLQQYFSYIATEISLRVALVYLYWEQDDHFVIAD